MADLQDKIRGSLIGGAVGDALGYEIEFIGEKTIFAKYGKEGITEYGLHPSKGKALISDDTQMTLFTAEAMTFYMKNKRERGEQHMPRYYIYYSYLDWLMTQEMHFQKAKKVSNGSRPYASELLNVPGLFARRAPGLTCLSGLEKRRDRKQVSESFIEDKINNSKGCGGVMRAAPVGMLPWHEMEKIDREGAECAAITHTNSLGYLPAAVLADIINRILFGEAPMTLKEIVEAARDSVAETFKNDEHIDEWVEMINEAIELSENNDADLTNIHRLGEGWVGDEALVIAIYCCLRYHYDFSQCIITSVNHKGDSDSTGAIAGNIIGAWLGYNGIESKWKDDLELADVILDVADKLCAEIEKEA